MQVLASRLFKKDLANMTCGIFQELASRFFNEMYLQVLLKFHKSDLLDPALTSVLQGPASS